LSLACSGGQTEVVSYLKTVVDIQENFFAFFAACESGQADTAALLIKHISPTTFCRTIETGESCLMAACTHGHLDVIILLFDRMEEFKVGP
jgi:ankyrin repeat protein